MSVTKMLTFRIQGIWSFLLFLDTFRIQRILLFLLLLDTFHIQGILSFLLFLDAIQLAVYFWNVSINMRNDQIP